VAPLTVLEFHRDGIWTLPRAQIDRLRDDFPDLRIEAPPDRAACDALVPEADVVFGWALRRDRFPSARRLRWIHVSAAGVGPLLFPELVESEVVVTNGRGLHALSMAEHTLGVMLGFARRLHLARDAQHAHRWTQKELWLDPPEMGEIHGGTLVLIGLGAVGGAIAPRAAALGLHVIAVRRHPAEDPAPAHEQWGTGRLGEALSRADWVVLAAPLTADTRGLIGARELAAMKPDAVLVNLGRGGLVDEPGLIEALRAGRIGGAALDVFAEEPLPAASPLWDLPNVIVTPHVSGIGPHYWERAVDLFERNLRAWLAGKPLVNVVDKRAGY
jgi:phosphoglycerate dehydrogenase-like enzyme